MEVTGDLYAKVLSQITKPVVLTGKETKDNVEKHQQIFMWLCAEIHAVEQYVDLYASQ